MELYTAAVTSALSGKFYESPKEFIARISDLVRRVDPVFVAQLAVYTRTQMNLRSTGTLKTHYTWENQLSALGQQHFESKDARKAAVKALWEELLDSGKVGYMALLRNLRNILQAGVSPEHIERLCARISAPGQVAKSRQLPYRFLAAYKEIMEESNPLVGLVQEALEKAVLCSADNIKGFGVNTNILLACDVSGSMYVGAGNRSSWKRLCVT